MVSIQIQHVNERLQTILAEATSVIGGINTLFLLDLEDVDVLAVYPPREEEYFDFIVTLCSKNISILESQDEDSIFRFNITEMIFTAKENQQIFISRISEDILLCMIGDVKIFKPNLAKRFIRTAMKSDIITTLQRMHIVPG